MKKRIAILQARMTSSRLPGKILMPVLGKPLLAYEIERLQRCNNVDDLVVATTTNTQDDTVAEWCNQQDVPCFRGSEPDVLERFHGAAQQAQADVVIRVTGDCPLIDPLVVDAVIAAYESNTVDYASNTLDRTFPRGLDVEVFSATVLTTCHQEAFDPVDREHVTPYIYRHPERFTITQYRQPSNHSHLRWTVDTPEDLELIRRVIEALYPDKPDFSQADILALLDKNPDWSQINAHIEQIKVQ